MSVLDEVCHEVGGTAEGRGLGWALVGGFAVSVRTEPRFTRDVDLVVAVDDDRQAESFVQDLLARGHAQTMAVEQEAVDRLAQVRIVLSDGQVADVLFASSGIEGEVVRAADPLEVLPGLVVPVATVGHLIVLKLLARDDERRPQDGADLVALAAVATEADRRAARDAAGLVEARGFARGRDLVGGVDAIFAT